MVDENRKFTRFYYKMRSEFSVNNYLYEMDELINLSIGGCLLPIIANAKSGDDCSLKILLGDNEEGPVVYIEGKVARIDDDTTAVNFTGIDPESLEHLHRIAQYNSPDPEKTEEEIKKHPGLF
ncbi:MAG: PilZ domain-containing protein [Deltaproteobacteria bacterium]|nr:PilZ domain-containing protein [Deltaproteobacteria bacterium]